MKLDPPNRGVGLRAILFSVALLVLVMGPMVQNFREKPRDGFPLSYYPMFTNQRKKTTRLIHPIGIKSDGTQINLNYQLVSDGGMNQARRQLGRLVDNDKANELCAAIAKKIQKLSDGNLADIVQVQIVEDTINIEGFFQGIREPKKRKVHAESNVDRKTH